MLPEKLKALRRALSETLSRTSLAIVASERRATELLERTRTAERNATDAALTPAEFWRLYGYAPKDARRMRELAEYLALGGGGSRARH